jgi:hypothetical protein
MEGSDITRIVRELCDLLDRQMETLRERKLDDLPDNELRDYEKRKARIAKLRAELQKHARPM